jgi:hypothetical protein
MASGMKWNSPLSLEAKRGDVVGSSFLLDHRWPNDAWGVNLAAGANRSAPRIIGAQKRGCQYRNQSLITCAVRAYDSSRLGPRACSSPARRGRRGSPAPPARQSPIGYREDLESCRGRPGYCTTAIRTGPASKASRERRPKIAGSLQPSASHDAASVSIREILLLFIAASGFWFIYATEREGRAIDRNVRMTRTK